MPTPPRNPRTRQSSPTSSRTDGVRGADHRHELRRRDDGQHGAECARRQRQQSALDQRLLDQAASSRTNRCPDRHLALPGRRAGHQQARDVRAGDEQHQRREGAQHPQRAREVFPQPGRAVRGGSQVDTGVEELLEAIGRLLGQPGCLGAAEIGQDRLQDGLRLLFGDTGLHPPPDLEPARVRVCDRAIVPHHRRRPDVGHDAWFDAGEAFRSHAHDLQRLLPDGDPAAEHIRVAAEPARPEVVAQHGDRVPARIDVITRRQDPAEGRLHAEDGERITRDPLAVDLLDLPAVVERGIAPRLVAHRKQTDLPAARRAQFAKERVVEAEPVAGLRRRAQREIDQRARIVDRQRPQDEGVDEREGGGTRANRQ